MQQLYESFLRTPNAANYLAIRELLITRQEPSDPLAIEELAHLVVSGQTDEAAHVIQRISQSWLLCPRFHYVVGQWAKSIDDSEQTQLSRFEGQSCLWGLLATGNGHCDHPYQATYLTDVEDVATAIGKTVRSKHLVQRNDQMFDLASCTDGIELWFACPHTETPVGKTANV